MSPFQNGAAHTLLAPHPQAVPNPLHWTFMNPDVVL